MVELRDLSLAYRLPHKTDIAALDHINAKFGEGKFSVIIGPSGCGKTSLIRIMAGLQKPTRGQALLHGNPVNKPVKTTALIFQDYGLLPWKTVRENAELPLLFNKNHDPEKRCHVQELLSKFGLGGFLKCYPQQLSGGMKQRLAIVRALVTEPELILMDEPFSSLDAITREEAQDYFLTVRNELKATIIMVSHSIDEAVFLGDLVYVMKGRNPGTFCECIPIMRDGSHAQFRDTPRFSEYCTVLRKMLKPETAS